MPHRRLSLAHLSMVEVPPHEVVEVACQAGFDCVSIRLTPTSAGIDHRILENPPALRKLRSAVQLTGIKVLDVEVLRIRQSGPDHASQAIFEAAACLEADYVIVVNEVQESDPAQEHLAALASSAAEFNLTLVLEPMIFSATRKLSDAVDLIQQVNEANLGVLPDVLHITRAGESANTLDRVPRELIHYLQICGVKEGQPATDLAAAKFEASHDRLPPDEGAVHVREFVNATTPKTVVAVECPTLRYADLDPTTKARHLMSATQRILQGAT
jgi:sugar phosphate isomerase/epimerase